MKSVASLRRAIWRFAQADWGSWSDQRYRESYWSGGYDPIEVPDHLSSEPLYHATTALSRVLNEGLKSRQQQGNGARGLGGGPDDKISLTYDLDYARNVEKGLRVMRAALAGELSTQDMIDIAREGGWYDQMVTAVGSTIGPSDRAEEVLTMAGRGYQLFQPKGLLGISETQMQGLGWLPADTGWNGRTERFHYTVWKPFDLNEVEDGFSEGRWTMYRITQAFLRGAEWAKIASDPTFFTTDVDSLAQVPDSEIGVVEVRILPGSKVNVHPAEREVRIPPEFLQVVREV